MRILSGHGLMRHGDDVFAIGGPQAARLGGLSDRLLGTFPDSAPSALASLTRYARAGAAISPRSISLQGDESICEWFRDVLQPITDLNDPATLIAQICVSHEDAYASLGQRVVSAAVTILMTPSGAVILPAPVEAGPCEVCLREWLPVLSGTVADQVSVRFLVAQVLTRWALGLVSPLTSSMAVVIEGLSGSASNYAVPLCDACLSLASVSPSYGPWLGYEHYLARSASLGELLPFENVSMDVSANALAKNVRTLRWATYVAWGSYQGEESQQLLEIALAVLEPDSSPLALGLRRRESPTAGGLRSSRVYLLTATSDGRVEMHYLDDRLHRVTHMPGTTDDGAVVRPTLLVTSGEDRLRPKYKDLALKLSLLDAGVVLTHLAARAAAQGYRLTSVPIPRVTHSTEHPGELLVGALTLRREGE